MPYHNEIIWQFLCFCLFLGVCMYDTYHFNGNCDTHTVYRYPLRHLKVDHEVISILRSLLTDNTPCPGKVGHTTGCLCPLLFSNSGVGSFTSVKNQISGNLVRRDLRVFVSYPRNLFYQLENWKNNELSLIFSPAEWMLYSSVLRKWLSSLWTKSYGMTIQKNPLPQYLHVVLLVIQYFPKLNLEFSLCLIFILITYGSKRVIDWMKWTPIRPAQSVRLIETEKLLRNTKDQFWVSVKNRRLITINWSQDIQISQRKLEYHDKWWAKQRSTCT